MPLPPRAALVAPALLLVRGCCRRLLFIRRHHCQVMLLARFARCSPCYCRRACLAPLIVLALVATVALSNNNGDGASQSVKLRLGLRPPLADSNSNKESGNNNAVAVKKPPWPSTSPTATTPDPSSLSASPPAVAALPRVADAASAAASLASRKPSAPTEEFLRRVAVESNDPGDPMLAALRSKVPLLNRLSEFDSRSLLDRAKSCDPVPGPKGTLTLKYAQNFAYLHNELGLCSGQLFVLTAVHSNAKNFNRRATIRRTWGSLRYVGSSRLQLVFFLGVPENRRIQRDIDAESRRYRDLVQLDFQEHYRNMSLKHLSIYEWVLSHCSNAQFLLKVDDDTFTDVVHMASFLQQSPPEGFYCSNTKGAKPQRLKRGPKAKWAVTRAEFSATRYPAYCEGFGYVLRASHLPDLYVCSLFHKFFWIDDVYVTGVLSAAAKVPLDEFWRGHSYTGQLPSLASEKILDYIFLVADHNEFLDVVWHRLWRSVLQYSLDLTL